MHIFIFGIFPEDSGKTIVAQGLLKLLSEKYSVDIAPFKPISGHNYWRQYETVILNKRLGMLFGSDIYRMMSTVRSSVNMDEICIHNPITFLFSPVDINKALELRMEIDQLLDETFSKNLILAKLTKVTFSNDKKVENIYFFNESLANRLIFDNELVTILKNSKNSEFRVITDSMDAVYFIKDHGEESIASCFKYLSGRFSYILTESFNNAVLPWSGVLESDIQIAVAPGYIFIFERNAFIRTIKNLINFYGAEITAPKLFRVITPKQKIRIPLRFDDKNIDVLNDVVKIILNAE